MPTLAPNFLVLLLASVVVWFAGGRLSAQAKAITETTRAGQAFVGALLLGGISSIPEMAMSMTAAANGNAPLAIGSLLGGVYATMTTIAVIDAIIGGPPLTRDVTRPVILLQGVLVICQLSFLGSVVILGDRLIGELLGVGSALLLTTYVLIVLLIRVQEKRRPWIVMETEPQTLASEIAAKAARADVVPVNIGTTVISALATAIAGYFLATSADQIADHTGIGSSFVGLVLGGFATTLPEMVTIYASVKLRQYEMAFADAFGTNLFSIMLIGLADVVYPGGPILNEAGRFTSIAVFLGILTTSIYLIGLIDRAKRTFFGLGYDSLAAICAYLIGLYVLFHTHA